MPRLRSSNSSSDMDEEIQRIIREDIPHSSDQIRIGYVEDWFLDALEPMFERENRRHSEGSQNGRGDNAMRSKVSGLPEGDLHRLYRSVGIGLRRLRKKDPNLSQAEVAKRAGISLSTLRKMERANEAVSRDTLEKVAKVLGQDLDEFIDFVIQSANTPVAKLREGIANV